MKNAIILHGMPGKKEYYSTDYPSASNSHWIPWLQKQLLINEIAASTPDIPRPFDLDYATWVIEFERFDINSETVLVGHSLGAGFLVRWLSDHQDIVVGKVVLVAPWLNLEQQFVTNFFDFKIDPNLVSRTKGIIIFNSDNDQSSVQVAVAELRQVVKGIGYREFSGYGHFTQKRMGTVEFPELVEAII